MRSTVYLSMLCSLVAISGCVSSDKRDHDNQPTEMTLYAPAPVLQAQLEISKDTVTLLSVKQIQGSPTSAVFKDRPLRITALGEDGKTIQQVALLNPLAVHTAGSSKPDATTLDRARVVVTLPAPKSIRALSVEITDGPGKGLKQVVRLKDSQSTPR